MAAPKSKSFIDLLYNTLLVTLAFYAANSIYYNVIDGGGFPPKPVMEIRIVVTIGLALVFAFIYDRASFRWRNDSPNPMIRIGNPGGKGKKLTGQRIVNGLLFGLLLGLLAVGFILLHFMNSIPDETAPVIAGSILGAGALELAGKTESDGDQGM